MFYFLSKALLIFLNPIVWILGLLVLSIKTSSVVKRKKYLWGAFLLLFVFSNPLLIHHIYRLWEPQTIAVDDISEPYDVGIVLSGYTNMKLDRPNKDHFYYLGDGYNRLLHSIELYKLNKINKILLSGRISSDNQDQRSKEYLVRNGVARADIFLETKSLNTYQSAANAQEMYASDLNTSSFLLITSSFHMPRAKRCFDKAGMAVTPFAVDRTNKKFNYSFNSLLPNSKAIGQWQRIFKEWVGVMVYKLMGYI